MFAVSTHNRVKLRACQLTDVGVVRDHNEDAAYVDPNHQFFIVADGMGGHAAGEIASAMAVDEVRKSLEAAKTQLDGFAKTPTDDGRRNLVQILENAVRSAHQAVFERGAEEADKQGMGTTLDVLLIAGCEAFVAHVGDSRTYLVRNGKAAQITTDHTVAEVLVIEGKLSMEEAQASPLRTILVNAVGVAPDVGVEMSHVRLRKGDLVLLCSDGLHDYFPADQELADFISSSPPQEALTKVIEIAKQRGGHDNITGVVLEVLECPPPLGEDTTGSSDGVPIEIGSVDTMPVDVGEDSPPKPLEPEADTLDPETTDVAADSGVTSVDTESDATLTDDAAADEVVAEIAAAAKLTAADSDAPKEPPVAKEVTFDPDATLDAEIDIRPRRNTDSRRTEPMLPIVPPPAVAGNPGVAAAEAKAEAEAGDAGEAGADADADAGEPDIGPPDVDDFDDDDEGDTADSIRRRDS